MTNEKSRKSKQTKDKITEITKLYQTSLNLNFDMNEKKSKQIYFNDFLS